MLRTAFLTVTATLLLVMAAVACNQLNVPIPATPTPTATPTPIPTATPAAAVRLGPVSDFDVRLNGLAVEGSFKAGGEPVSFTYRPDHVEAVEAGLRVSGVLTYAFLGGTHALSDLGAVLTPAGDDCDRLGVTTDPVELPQFGVSIPGQQLEFDLNRFDQANGSVPARMVCRAARLAVEQADNPLTRLLINQINRLLEQ